MHSELAPLPAPCTSSTASPHSQATRLLYFTHSPYAFEHDFSVQKLTLSYSRIHIDIKKKQAARKEGVSMPAAEDELQPSLVKLKSFMRLGLSIFHSRERAQAAKVAAQVAANARAEAALAADADADAEAEASAQADADADANG
jgi:hypothetical protein